MANFNQNVLQKCNIKILGEQGEKPAKYFLSVEKRNYVNKTVDKRMQQWYRYNLTGRYYSRNWDVLKKLYSCHDKVLQDVAIELLYTLIIIRVLDENMSNNSEGYITNEEALLA